MKMNEKISIDEFDGYVASNLRIEGFKNTSATEEQAKRPAPMQITIKNLIIIQSQLIFELHHKVLLFSRCMFLLLK